MKDLLLKLYIKAQILREDHGQDMVEYALVVGIIACGCTAGMKTVATAINAMFTTLSTGIAAQAAKIPQT